MDSRGGVACLGDFLAGEQCPGVQERMHNNSMGATTARAEAAAAAQGTNLEAALAEQHAAQLNGLDVPMLEDLLALEDLHDPFLEDWGSSHMPPLQFPAQHQGQHQQAGCQPRFAPPRLADAAPQTDPCDPGGMPQLSPAAAGLCGVPAYAEPDSPAAAALNNAGSGQIPGLVLGAMAVTHSGSGPPGLQLTPGAVAMLGQQHGFAATQMTAGSAAAQTGLPPAIAAAQHRAAAATVHMQLAVQQQFAAHAQQLGQPIVHLKPVLVQLPVQQSDRPSSSDGAGGGSRCSNASNGSTRHTAATLRNSSEFSGNQRGAADAGDDAGGPTGGASATAAGGPGAVVLPIPAGAAASAPSLSAATGITFTAGTATAEAAASGGSAPAKRGGRPREKKSYDALIDPSLPIEEVRRLRRMLSNRESARRSRRRRQSQLSGLEEELEQLKNDKERLQSELHHTSRFAQQLSTEKQQLLAEVERLRCQLAAVSTSSPTATAATQQQQAQACTMGPAAPVGSAGRLPPLIEKAQRLAQQLNQPRLKEEGGISTS